MTKNVKSPVKAIALFLACASQTGQAQQEIHGGGEERTRLEGRVESKYIVRLETTQQKQYCQATAALEYLQHDTIASVSGTISNNDCAASSGTFTLGARIRDENGEVREFEFEGEWIRDDDRPVSFQAEYPIGRNVDLLRVRPTGLRCICAAAASLPGGEAVGDELDDENHEQIDE